jgi:hypothetical protein
VQDLVALQVAGVGVRGLAGPHGLGATYSGSTSSVYSGPGGSSSEGDSTDWAGVITALTTGASSIITAAKADTNPPAVQGSTAPLYTPPAPPPPQKQGVDLSAVLPFAALVIGGVLGALVTRAL